MAEFVHDPVKMEIYLDDQKEPLGVYRPPATFELDTAKLADGPHRLRIRAWDRAGVIGVREIDFIVRNGPGIAVVGLTQGDIVEGRIPVLVNAYAGTHDANWEPSRAETPAPVPTWAWILFLLISVWAGYYWFDSGFLPPPEYGESPTFSSPSVIAAAAGGARAPGAAAEFDWMELGARVYQQRCVECHAASGEGIAPFVPSLRGADAALAADPNRFLRKTLDGTGGPRPPADRWRAWMPAYAGTLSDDEIAAVENHIRTNWGNTAPTVRPEQVQALRPGRAGP
jgi:mono/diheme cytochrome c family protein